MKTVWFLLAMVCIVAMSPTLPSQTLDAPARAALNTARPLQPAEIAIVLAAARDAVAGKTCRLSYAPDGPGPEVLIGANGWPRFVRATSGRDYVSSASSSSFANGSGVTTQSQQRGHVDVVTFTEYTGRSARKCDGTAVDGDLVIEYEHKSSDNRWTVTARTRAPHEFAAPLFDMLAGVIPAESGDRRSFGDRVGRALVAPWTLPPGAMPGGPLPAGITQSLWIDTVSLLPLRWSISMPAMPERGAPAMPDYGLSFTYDPSLDLRPPDDVVSPDCIR
jgi:hypothetical protein